MALLELMDTANMVAIHVRTVGLNNSMSMVLTGEAVIPVLPVPRSEGHPIPAIRSQIMSRIMVRVMVVELMVLRLLRLLLPIQGWVLVVHIGERMLSLVSLCTLIMRYRG